MSTKTKKAPAKKATTAKPRWSLGLARNDAGELITVYVRADGSPMSSTKKPLNGNGKILAHGVYTGVTYKEARQRLLKESKLKDAPVEKEKKAKATK